MRACALILISLITLTGLTQNPEVLPGSKSPQARLYDAKPTHRWNRLHDLMFVRKGPDGRYYGHDRIDPLL